MIVRTEAGRLAASAALRLRSKLHLKPWEAVDIFDLVQTLGLELRFIKVSSLEGMYVKQELPTILVSAERPAGRRRFTCAHELGHHVFGHGSRVDEIFCGGALKGSSSYEERLADMFAAYLLMPRSAVQKAFATRHLEPMKLSPRDIYAVAGWLGVGYSTLVTHLHVGLKLISASKSEDLLRVQPRAIRQEILGVPTANLTIVDKQWIGRSVDLEVGDYVLAPTGSISEGSILEQASAPSDRCLFRALTPGIGRLSSRVSEWATFVRVSRKDFEGRSIFRHLEEVEDD